MQRRAGRRAVVVQQPEPVEGGSAAAPSGVEPGDGQGHAAAERGGTVGLQDGRPGQPPGPALAASTAGRRRRPRTPASTTTSRSGPAALPGQGLERLRPATGAPSRTTRTAVTRRRGPAGAGVSRSVDVRGGAMVISTEPESRESQGPVTVRPTGTRRHASSACGARARTARPRCRSARRWPGRTPGTRTGPRSPTQTFLASRVEPPFSGKNASGSVCAHSARSCQDSSPSSSAHLGVADQ